MSKKKVGITTLQGEDNYGNVLQNYAVQFLIESLGYEAYTLDNKTEQGFLLPMEAYVRLSYKLRPAYILTFIKLKLGLTKISDLNPFCLVNNLKERKTINKLEERRHEKFTESKKRYNHYIDLHVEEFAYARESYEDFYAFVTGSDQVWNPMFAPVSSVNFLRFVPEHKRIAFSVSFGVSQIPEKRRQILKKWISDIPSVSVREKKGVDIIRDLNGREVTHLLDPTFAIDKSIWEKYGRSPEFLIERKKYALVYFLGEITNEYNKWINRYVKRENLKTVSIHDTHAKEYYCVDPNEFVWLIENAAIVLTDSFHGMAISMNLNTPFVVFNRKELGSSMSSRIESILADFHLEYCLFKGTNYTPKRIDFEKVNSIIEKERQRTIEWLRNSLLNVASRSKHPLIASDVHCTGCGACFNSCPFNAITMEPDEEGFIYPTIDKDKCMGCLRCEESCPQDRKRENLAVVGSYYATSKSKDILEKSSSGGVFYYLSKEVLSEGGVVFGAAFDSYFNVYHEKITNISDLEKIMRSKYVQSNTGLTFKDVYTLLNDGKKVLFSGTPCQVAGLRRFLRKDYNNLITVDLLCHGIPSPFVWEKYRQEVSKGNTSGIESVNFRSKLLEWREYSLQITFVDRKNYFKSVEKDPYLRSFLANLILRPSCYRCQYRHGNRKSDITLSDFWGVPAVLPDRDNKDGVSHVMIQSEKGLELFTRIASESFEFGQVDALSALRYNEAADVDPLYTKMRDDFFERINSGESIAHCVDKMLWKDSIRFGMARMLRYASKIKHSITDRHK